MILDKQKVMDELKQRIKEEGKCLYEVADSIDDSFCEAVILMDSCQGRVIISGIGKSGHVGRKIAASLASLGIPSYFVHSCESLHGDLGMVKRDDVAVLISNSGKTAEVLGMIPSLKLIGVKIIAITGNNQSPLSKEADIVLCVNVKSEIDDLNLAPTSSTTAVLAVGDAIACTVSSMRSFKKEDFAVFHPGGALGKLAKSQD